MDYQGQLELYRQEFYSLSLQINLMEVELSHSRKEIALLVEELEDRFQAQKEKDKVILGLQSQLNSLREQNKWLEDELVERNDRFGKESSSQLQKLNAALQDKDREIKRLEQINVGILKENQDIRLEVQHNRKTIEQIESRIRSQPPQRPSSQEQQQELQERLGMLLKKIQVKQESRFSRMFNSRLLAFPTNSTMDGASKVSGFHS